MFGSLCLPPFTAMIAGALLLPFLPKSVRSAAFILFPLLSLIIIWTSPFGELLSVGFAGYTLILSDVDALSRIFGTIFSLIAFIGGIYAFNLKETAQQVAALLYAGGSLGVVFAGDYFTLFMFWELMAAASVYLIWARRTNEAAKAGMRYIIVHLFGGVLLLSGILLHLASGGGLEIGRIAQDGSLSSWLILLGVGLNAAIPPLHAWLADAYPRATVTGAVFLSAFTTKTAVYVLIRIFPGWEILIFAGVIMALYGVVYAVLANDIREILAYHIISQVGYMVTGVGIGTALALNGAVAHAFCHILYKALLFMGAGVALHTTGTSKLADLGGFARYQKAAVALYMIGAFSISGFPLFNGFISKSMVISAAGASHLNAAMLLLLLASVGTFLHTGLKLPYFTWFGEDKGIRPSKTPRSMLIAMAIAAFFCTLLGVAPSILYAYLPFDATFHPYTIPHLVETVQILTFTFIGFWVLRGKLAGDYTIAIDTDWFYRRPKTLVWTVFVGWVNDFFDAAERTAMNTAHAVAAMSKNPARYVIYDGSDDPAYSPARYRQPVSAIILCVLVSFIIFALAGIFT
jgi:multicomponent Na+:H+ antiporter subunit D